MTGSPLLDLFLAMALFYFALCMVCSSVNDGVARILKWRANTLRDGIRSLLLNATVARNPSDPTAGKVELLDAFFQHPFVQTLRLQADLGETWLSRHLDGLADRLKRVWRVVGPATPDPNQPQLDPQTKLTFIPSGVFVHTLCEIVRPNGTTTNEPLTFAALWRAIDQLPDATAGPLKVVLKSLANDPTQNLDAVQAKLAKWFDDGMDQATVWYRHRMRTVSIVIGAIMSFGLNIDSVEVANRFYGDANLRSVYAAAGKQVGTSDTPVQKAQAEKAPVGTTSGEKAPATQTVSVNPIRDLQLGWQTTDPEAIWAKLQGGMKWAGLILTVVAIGMGTSFWHDVLTRLVGQKDGKSSSGIS